MPKSHDEHQKALVACVEPLIKALNAAERDGFEVRLDHYSHHSGRNRHQFHISLSSKAKVGEITRRG